MFLLTIFLFLFILPFATEEGSTWQPGGTELQTYNQTNLEVNILDQCMTRPEVGPNGIYESAMRFHFFLPRTENTWQNCTGSVLMCYPGQLDPEKNIGLVIPTMPWSIPNMDNNTVAEECILAQKRCLATLGHECQMPDTPWHGIRISFGEDGHLDFEMSIGGRYQIPMTNFTLMLHNNEIYDKTEPTAFLIDDYDYRDICASPQDAFPIAGQDKPVLVKIPLHGNDASYKDWKNSGGHQNSLEDYQHLFRLSWDILPKSQLEFNDLMHIWTDNSTANCSLRVFFMDRMQRTVDNLEICPEEVELVPSEICHTIDWMKIKAAKLEDKYGKELVVRMGFINIPNQNEKANYDYEEYRYIMLADLPGNGTALDLAFGDFFYASVQDHFNLGVSMDEQLEAFVYNCTFGTVSTKIRISKDDKSRNQHPLLDWSKDFEDVKQCIRSQKLLDSRPLAKKRNLIIKARNVKNGISDGITRLFIKAHQYKFGYFPRLYRNSTVESAENYSRVKLFGKFFTHKKSSLDIYNEQNFQRLEAFVNAKPKIIQSYISNGTLANNVKIGLYGLQYACGNVTFQLPRFNVAIVHQKNPLHLKGYLANQYTVEIDNKQWKIQANREIPAKCLYNLDENQWIYC